jgi:hypothetical protein
VRRTAAAGLALAAALLAACAPHLLPAPPEAPTITGTWAENRDRFPAVSALADVTLDADGARLAWPEFTAVFAFHAPDRVAVTGFSPMGALLFSYESGDGRYTLRGPDPDRVKTGRLGARGADPESRLLGALVHVLDGVLGPDTGDTPVGVDPDGRWVVKAGRDPGPHPGRRPGRRRGGPASPHGARDAGLRRLPGRGAPGGAVPDRDRRALGPPFGRDPGPDVAHGSHPGDRRRTRAGLDRDPKIPVP